MKGESCLAEAKGWTVYIIQTNTGVLYTGITTDLNRRFQEHAQGKKGAKFFNTCAPKSVLLQENYPCRSTASKRECAIKKMTRVQKLKLIDAAFAQGPKNKTQSGCEEN